MCGGVWCTTTLDPLAGFYSHDINHGLRLLLVVGEMVRWGNIRCLIPATGVPEDTVTRENCQRYYFFLSGKIAVPYSAVAVVAKKIVKLEAVTRDTVSTLRCLTPNSGRPVSGERLAIVYLPCPLPLCSLLHSVSLYYSLSASLAPQARKHCCTVWAALCSLCRVSLYGAADGAHNQMTH